MLNMEVGLTWQAHGPRQIPGAHCPASLAENSVRDPISKNKDEDTREKQLTLMSGFHTHAYTCPHTPTCSYAYTNTNKCTTTHYTDTHTYINEMFKCSWAWLPLHTLSQTPVMILCKCHVRLALIQ